MADYLPKFKPGEAITITATATLTGGQLVTVAGAVAAADSVTFLGVVSRDAVSGQSVGVYTDAVQRLTAAGAFAAGTPLKCAANGQVTTWVSGTDNYDRYVGLALEASAGAASVVAVRMAR